MVKFFKFGRGTKTKADAKRDVQWNNYIYGRNTFKMVKSTTKPGRYEILTRLTAKERRR